MNKTLLCALAVLSGNFLFAADSGPIDDIKTAAAALSNADNYAWTTTIESTQFRPGPSSGQTEKNGYTYLTFAGRDDNKMEAVIKGGKALMKTEDGWQTPDEASKGAADGQFNPTRFLAGRLRTFQNPAEEAPKLAAKAKDLTKTDNVYSGDLTEDSAKGLMMFRPRGAGAGDGPKVSNAKGSVKFWVKDGALTKFQYRVQGTVSFNGNDRDVDRTTTVEISGVGTTKVTVPEGAKKKLS